MHDFKYSDGELFCENVALARIAAEVGTPVYVYSRHTLTDHYHLLEDAFSGFPSLICYSIKANSNRSVITLLANEGAGADIVSGGELWRALRAGVPPEKIVYAGIGKKAGEMVSALEAGILMFNVESLTELETLNQVAGEIGKVADIALRVNPDVDPDTHPYIATGLKEAKFGINIEQALAIYERADSLPNIRIVGVHQHIGSQITSVEPFQDSLSKLKELLSALQDRGFDIRFINIGGGFGIPYHQEEVPRPSDYAEALGPILKETGCQVILEIGRMIVGNAGVLMTEVLYRKQTGDKGFLVVDAAMNDLIRPSLYGSFHELLPLTRTDAREEIMDVVGPVCESGDFLARDRAIPRLEPGDLLAVMSAGAYSFAMSSNYNSRPRAAEVMVDGSEYRVVRDRESYEDLVRGEHEWE
ncbi:MAG: diaminopimelate decarboxylase [Actinobacteria bacterium RBG_19FT_COMBO_54_7]|uniref:Diaminopimelate decarboxylase n=1 Tax=Candidatus Solincola sediminis TaxID=1797199 RepID=A0A1F2WF31_9ACTN|nr:MAG: diaminopimelate decarboxylase [Candidatus Solincola sediminis]OFW57849.1 MAG: diaminopimelate decarboxylase [Candidatus Solincola sediminis]OFW68352.1 MAG: diaminopimelate decarboxylase [Actinobacteria bacterium RBG_19FT_COMBO_54_7]